MGAKLKPDKQGKLPSHIFGDSQVTAIHMSLEKIEITFSPHEGMRDIQGVTVLRCIKPSFVKLESDHLQNVVDDVFILQDLTGDVLALLPFAARKVFFNKLPNQTLKLLLITPISGIEAYVVCQDVQMV